jgi:hypothetical protein
MYSEQDILISNVVVIKKQQSDLELLHQNHYVKTSNRSRSNGNGPLTPVTCTHICNGCYLALVTDKCGWPTPGLASVTPVTNVDFW